MMKQKYGNILNSLLCEPHNFLCDSLCNNLNGVLGITQRVTEKAQRNTEIK
jgi:hypothetical protein